MEVIRFLYEDGTFDDIELSDEVMQDIRYFASVDGITVEEQLIKILQDGVKMMDVDADITPL